MILLKCRIVERETFGGSRFGNAVFADFFDVHELENLNLQFREIEKSVWWQ